MTGIGYDNTSADEGSDDPGLRGCAGAVLWLIAIVLLLGVLVRSWHWAFHP